MVFNQVNSNNSQKNWIIPNYLNWKLSQKQEPFLTTSNYFYNTKFPSCIVGRGVIEK